MVLWMTIVAKMSFCCLGVLVFWSFLVFFQLVLYYVPVIVESSLRHIQVVGVVYLRVCERRVVCVSFVVL